ncbi:MAG: adenylate/guanylate cyclase domain-containing protein [Chloroflexi bacterium]|nr:adenylate/guanylate cyclase domain-containing protein [Chloroflexota bacterium]
MPDTKYTRSGDLNIAYQVVGEGEIDLVFVSGWTSHLEYQWEDPELANFLNRLASFSRLILFDKRGTGMSDRVADSELPMLEERMDDVRVVMDAAGSEKAVLMGFSEGGPMCLLFGATYPERCRGLVLYGSYARWMWEEGYTFAPTAEEHERRIAIIESTWGAGFGISMVAPSAIDDERARERWGTFQRRASSPGAGTALYKMNVQIDVRDASEAVRVPTLVMHRVGDSLIDVRCGRYMAEHIPNAKYVELPDVDHLPWYGDSDRVIAEVEEFVTGKRSAPGLDRVLATVMFTDIVGSTEKASKLGDKRWKSLLGEHADSTRRQLARFGGKEIKSTGDGVLATFDGPGRGVRCAQAILADMPRLGIEVRAGLHTGEVEMLGEDIGGIAVHIASRVSSLARPSEVLVSRTVKDLVAGSGIAFEGRGSHSLKGVPGDWELFAARA